MILKVNRKHERLQSEMERISSVLPTVAAAAGRAKEALVDPVMRLRNNRQVGDAPDYDRQVSGLQCVVSICIYFRCIIPFIIHKNTCNLNF